MVFKFPIDSPRRYLLIMIVELLARRVMLDIFESSESKASRNALFVAVTCFDSKISPVPVFKKQTFSSRSSSSTYFFLYSAGSTWFTCSLSGPQLGRLFLAFPSTRGFRISAFFLSISVCDTSSRRRNAFVNPQTLPWDALTSASPSWQFLWFSLSTSSPEKFFALFEHT